MEERTQKLEVFTARNGEEVPVLDGIYLHSIYNPTKEANALANQYADKLSQSNNALIIGLGFGYHVLEIAKTLQAQHGEYEVYILEPSKELIEEFKTRFSLPNNIKIVHYLDQSIYLDYSFVEFLTKKPTIIKHETSFNIHKETFKTFLSYRAPKDMDSFLEQTCSEFQETLKDKIPLNFDEHIIAIEKSGISHKNDFALLALNEIIKE